MVFTSKLARRTALALSTSIAALGIATMPASAALVVNGTDLAPFVFNGIVDPGPVVVPGLSATLDLGAAVFAGNTVSFSYNIANTTDSNPAAPAITARLRAFGFNVDGGTLTALSASSVYTNEFLGDNFPNVGGFGGTRDACFAAPGGGGCTGGSGGLLNGQSTTGTLTLTFASAVTSVNLDDFVVRYQSIGGAPNGATSGIGVVTGVPEPSTWAMMLIGFAGLAFASRRRNSASFA